ncbi:MAG: phage tail tape measure protein [Ruminococcus sp.]|nr:phage tail tape measure protein [Ruminococcus sp.]
MARNNKIKGLTVEIGGDTTKLGQALDNSKKNSQSLQKELWEVNKLLKGDPQSVELLAQKETLLKQRVEETKKQLDLLKGSQEDVQKLFENGDIGEADYRAFQRQIESTQQTLDSLQTDLSETSSRFTEVQRSSENINFKTAENKVDYLKDKFKDLATKSAESVKKVSDQVSKAGKSIESVGSKLTPVSAGATGVLAVGVKLASDFEDAIAKVSTIADTSKKPIDELRQEIINLSNETGVDAAEIANNVYDAISAGQDTADAVNFVKNATSLAKAGFADTGASLDVLTTILNAYGLEAKEVTTVSDTLIQTQNLGKTTVAQLASSMGKVIPTANSYGVNLQQIATGYAVMTSNGVATAESTTYMNSMLNELGKSGTKASTVLKEQTGKSFSDLMNEGKSLSDVLKIVSDAAEKDGKKFNDMWGSAEAAKAGTILLGDGVDKFNSVLAKMGKSSGSTSTALSKLETTSTKTKKTVNELKNVGIELGSEVLVQAQPLLTDVMNGVKGLTEWIKKLNPEQKEMLVKGIELIAILGPGTTAVGKLTKNVGDIVGIIPKVITKIVGMTAATEGATVAQEGLNVAQSANPIGLIISLLAGAGGLIALLIGLKNASDEAKNKAYELTDEQKKNREEVEKLRDAYAEYENKKSESLSSASSEFNYYEDLWNELQKIVDKNGKVKEGYEERVSFITEKLSEATDKEIKLNDGVIESYGNLKDSMKEYLELAKGRAVISGLEGSYTEAVTNKDTAERDRDNAEADMYEKYKKMQEAAAKYSAEVEKVNKAEKDAKANRISYGDYIKILDNFNDNVLHGNIKKAFDSAKEDYTTAKEKYETLEETAASYARTIEYYEDLSAAVTSEDSEKISSSLEKLQNNFVTASNGTKQSLEKQTKDIKTQLDNARSKYNAGIGGITQDYIKELESRYSRAQSEENKYKEANKQTHEEIFDNQIRIDELLREHEELKNQNIKTAAESNRETLQKQVEDYQQHYVNLKAAFDEGAPGVTEEMVNSASEMVNRTKQELDKIPEKITETSNASKDAVVNGSFDINNAWNTSLAEQISNLTNKKIEFEDLGNGQVQMYVDGLVKGEPKAKSEMSQLVNGVVKKIKDKNADTKQAAEYLLEGFDDGIQNPDKQKNIFDHIGTFGNLIIAAFKAIFHISSPSKVTREIGGYLSEGLAVGISEKAGDAVDQAEQSARLVVSSFGKAIGDKTVVSKNAAELSRAAAKALNEAGADYSLGLSEKPLQAKVLTEHSISQDNRQAAQITAILEKLDTLTKTVEKSSQKEIRLNDDTLVGSTANKYDRALGAIAARRERGW